jgi:outer membrane protein OmpA-like peptidoglycan-associated protein
MYGYYSAILDGGMGGHDLYRVLFLGSEKELVTATRDQLIAGREFLKGGFLTPPVPLSLDTTLVVEGRVIDPKADTVPILAKLTFIDPDDGTANYTTMTGDSGKYVARLPEPKIYGVEINATGYLYFLDILDLTGKSGDNKIHQDFFLERVEVGTKVVLDNIYFETGKAVLRPESFDALDQVYRFLDNNPTVKLEISGHTDNTGSLRINTRLSKERAKAVVDYLTSRGIPEERLVYEGYADTQPIAPNNTAEGREKNRRVEFKVLSK